MVKRSSNISALQNKKTKKQKTGSIKSDHQIITKNNHTYEGEFKDDKLNGQGKITYSGGKIKEGEFKDGWLNGHGKIYDQRKKLIEQGKYRNEELVTGIVYIWKDNGTCVEFDKNGNVISSHLHIIINNLEDKAKTLTEMVGNN